MEVAETLSYSQEWIERLKNGFDLEGQALQQLDSEYGVLLAEVIGNFMARNAIKKVDLIASHGHTLFHKPEEGYTLQIGNGPEISEELGLLTICDFRTQDVALGGQGAPLVPIGDALLFSDYNSCLNLGGFANISFDLNGRRTAFDIGPCNILLNHYARKLGLNYDDKGSLAASGKPCNSLLDDLNALPYFSADPPKSLGFEYVVEVLLPMIDAHHLEIRDVLRTCVEHTARQLANTMNTYSLGNCLVTGGGAYNDFLLERTRSMTDTKLELPDTQTIDFKEALVFAFLGYLKNFGLNNCLSHVTGASRDHSSGKIYQPSNLH
jgi:anhydro-N-acetylmuramic acid kinase